MAYDGVRVNITQAGDSGKPVVGEIRLYDTVGGSTNLVTGTTGAITASESNAVSSSKDGSKVFDGDASTRWECSDVASVSTPQWVQGLFANNVTTIAEVGVVATTTFASLVVRHPIDGSIELRDASTGTWSEVGTYSGVDLNGGEEHRVAVDTSSQHDVTGSVTAPADSATGNVTFATAHDVTGSVTAPADSATGNAAFALATVISDATGAATAPADSATGSVGVQLPHDFTGAVTTPADSATGSVTFQVGTFVNGSATAPADSATGSVAFITTRFFTGAATAPADSATGSVTFSNEATAGIQTSTVITTRLQVSEKRRFTLITRAGATLDIGGGFWRVQPEKPAPMGEPDIELVRRHSEDEIESTGDGLPKPELWAWQGHVLGQTPDELAANKRLLNDVVERCRKVTRGDGAIINISQGSRPMYAEDDDNPYLAHTVTFLLAPRLPYWLEPDTRTWETFFAFPFPYPDEFIRSY